MASVTRGDAMNADRPTRSARVDGVVRAMLGIVLLAAVLWALAGAGDASGFDFARLSAW